MITIKDIARLSGYSIGTVSRVLNNHPDVSEHTRKKIKAVIAQEHFQPNSNAKQLKQSVSSSIAILVKGYGNILFAELLEQVQGNLREKGEEASVFYLDENSNSVASAYQLCLERKPKGFIFLGGNLLNFENGFEEIKVPCVLLTNTAKSLHFKNLSSYSTDDIEAASCAIRHLIERGHSHIGIVGGIQADSQISSDRLKGCIKELENHQIKFVDEYYEESRFSMGGGYTSTIRLLTRCPEITAIFALSDSIAVGVMRAIKDLGKRIPEDISLIGFDGIELSQFCLPRLATIHQDTQVLAKRGVDDLLLRLNYKSVARHEIIPFQFVKGESIKNK